MLTFECANTIILWVFSTEFKKSPFHIISFILTTLENEQQPFKKVIVDKYGALESSTDVTNLFVESFRMSKKILVIMNHLYMEIMKYTPESSITLLDQSFLTWMNTKKIGSFRKRHHKKSIDASSTVH